MSTPLRAAAFAAALRAEGVNVTEHVNWQTHNRNHKGDWGPVHGVVIHHTAGRNSMELCWEGVNGLPGPLCHTHLAKNGAATLISSGRSNHAGTFAQNAYDAVVNESSAHPRPDAAEPVDGNARFYGIEIENLGDGNDPYPLEQYQAAVRWATAICRAHGWSANSVIGHKEGTRRKIDPSFGMDAFRACVAERLAHAADWSGSEEDEMTITATEIAEAVWAHKLTSPTAADGTDPQRAAGTFLRYTDAKQKALLDALSLQRQTTDKLVEAVAVLAAGVGDLDVAAIITELRTAIESIDVRFELGN